MENNRIGVFLCHCGSRITCSPDCQKLAEQTRAITGVVFARACSDLCSGLEPESIREDIEKHNLNLVLLIACTPCACESIIRQEVRQIEKGRVSFQFFQVHYNWPWFHEESQKATKTVMEVVLKAVDSTKMGESANDGKKVVSSSVLVVGAGIAGLQAALDLADNGHKVILVEKSQSVGGHLALFDKVFPTLENASNLLASRASRVLNHPGIQLLTGSEVVKAEGSAGCFGIGIAQTESSSGGRSQGKAANVDEKQSEMHSADHPQSHSPGQGQGRGPGQGRGEGHGHGQGKNKNAGGEVGTTLTADLRDFREVTVGAVIIATGFQEFDPSVIFQYGYRRLPNILTGLEFEKMYSRTGSTGGRILLADGSVPETIAILHCAGGRDKNYVAYCSRTCCMSSLKYAYTLLEKAPQSNIYHMYIDMRCSGPGYEEFYERLQHEGVNFIRGRAAEISDRAISEPEKGKLIVSVEDTLVRKKRRIAADLVILSCPLVPRDDTARLARTFSIETRADGFLLESHFKTSPVRATREGIFLAGCCQGPKDIQESISQASAAAMQAVALLNSLTCSEKPAAPAEHSLIMPSPKAGSSYLIYIGIDDTDILDGPGTGQVAKALAQCLVDKGLGQSLGVSRHQLLMDSRVRSTSHNSSKGLAMLTDRPETDFYEPAIVFMKSCFVEGSDPGLCFCPEEKMNQEIIEYGYSSKKLLLCKEDAFRLAAKYAVFLRELGGDGGGVIGALASVGLRAAGDDGRVIDLKGIKEIKGVITAGQVLAQTDIVRVQDMQGHLLRDDELIDSRDWLRPSLVGGQPVLRVKPGQDKDGHPIWIPAELKFKDMIKEKKEY
jgi:heterodisulfide reductase subunit A2